MARGLIAKKVGMTQLFDESGQVVPVTILKAGPCVVTQVKTDESDSYNAHQIGFGEVRESLLTKAEAGHLKKAGLPALKYLREFRDTGLDLTVGQRIGPDIFEVGENVKVTGTSKGKGFQGAIKRHGFAGGRASHGSKFHRSPGSMGSGTYPGKVFKGKKMPGRDGGVEVTVSNLKIVKVDSDNQLLLVSGAVPGPRESLVTIEAM